FDFWFTMTHAPLKLTACVLGAALSLAMPSVIQAEVYHIVVPAQGKLAPYANIKLKLNEYAFPNLVLGEGPLTFDFKNVLQITGDDEPDLSQARFSVYSGMLPAGISLSTGGILSGTPTEEGPHPIQLQVRYKTKSVVGSYSLPVSEIRLEQTGSPSLARQNEAYSLSLSSLLSVTGDPNFTSGELQWEWLSGTLPEGLVYSAEGSISGTTNKFGTFPFSVRAAYKGRLTQLDLTL